MLGISKSVRSFVQKEQGHGYRNDWNSLAKSEFAVHGVGASGLLEMLRPEVRRHKVKETIASLPPCLIGMEVCWGAQHWAREFEKMRHTVRVMAAKVVELYGMTGKRGKNDANDAAAIC
jgi:transposase